jgi:hypothetical protein
MLHCILFTCYGVLLYVLHFLFLQEAKTYAQENGLFFMETSAKTATNVNDIFYEIGEFTFIHFRWVDGLWIKFVSC